jgi:phosphatidylinositol alpha-1,6-mannosyltransferase
MSEILFVSKPMAAPWTDGTKTLVRDLACAMTRHEPVVLGVRGRTFELPRGRVEPLFSAAPVHVGGASPFRLATRLAIGRRGDVWHFVFTPTARTTRASRMLARLRGAPTIQTITSLPPIAEAQLRALAFADRVVVLSRATERRMIEAGVPRATLRRIAPCAEPLRWTPELAATGRVTHRIPATAPVIVFPGDVEPGRGAREMIEAFARIPSDLGAMLVMATRRKTSRSMHSERELRALAAKLRVDRFVRWVGETPRMHALLACADVVALPATDLTAKVDLPIVLLEAMSLGRAVVVAAGTSAAELAGDGAALAVDIGQGALGEALVGIIRDTERRRSLGSRAAAADYSAARMARDYETLYDELAP